MAMQTDVKATEPLTSTATFKIAAGTIAVGRCRIKGIFAVCGASAGTVSITDGSGGAVLLLINTPTVANAGSVYMLLPGEGILAASGPYGTVTNTASIVLFYG
tara:strand:- start:1016 stop:1324 length:309 start_codon:yes stop_codon:yes gene_type:complete